MTDIDNLFFSIRNLKKNLIIGAEISDPFHTKIIYENLFSLIMYDVRLD